MLLWSSRKVSDNPWHILWHYAHGRMPDWINGGSGEVAWIKRKHRGIQWLDKIQLPKKSQHRKYILYRWIRRAAKHSRIRRNNPRKFSRRRRTIQAHSRRTGFQQQDPLFAILASCPIQIRDRTLVLSQLRDVLLYPV